MNKSMILSLIEDGQYYLDNVNLNENKEYEKYNDEVHEMLEEFCKNLPKDKKHDVIWKFELAQGALETITADEYFKEGFKLGLIIGAQNFLD